MYATPTHTAAQRLTPISRIKANIPHPAKSIVRMYRQPR